MNDPIMPRIVTYESADAPAMHRFCGRFFLGSSALPIFFHHDDRGELITVMRDWWAAEQAKRAKAEADRAARSARMRRGVQ